MQGISDHILGAASLMDANHNTDLKIEVFMHSTTAFELKRFSKLELLCDC